jgi:peptidoglycan hydrolase-like protein with peptidoglycan-binding domain
MCGSVANPIMPPVSATLTPNPARTRVQDDARRPASSAPEGPAREYVVVRGDTLTSIAARHDTSVAALIDANPAVRARPNELRIGQRIQLPEGPSEAPARVRADDATVAGSRSRALGAETLSRARVGETGELKRGASGAAVETLQTQLNSTGSARPVLKVDGDFGRRTEAALKRYQTSRGLPPSGVVDGATQTALAENRAALEQPMSIGAFGPAVRELQRDLNRHGASLNDDGDFGGGTERAVKAFQRANHIDDDGVVGPDTRAALDSPTAQRIPEDSRDPSGRTATGYRNGVAFPLELVGIGHGEALGRDAAESFLRMKDAAARDGVNLNVVSAFRTQDEQRSLYRAYQRGQGNLAAPPGYSNHQNGIALDITTGGSRRSASYRWLAANAERFGFANTVPSEPWHWEYRR